MNEIIDILSKNLTKAFCFELSLDQQSIHTFPSMVKNRHKTTFYRTTQSKKKVFFHYQLWMRKKLFIVNWVTEKKFSKKSLSWRKKAVKIISIEKVEKTDWKHKSEKIPHYRELFRPHTKNFFRSFSDCKKYYKPWH